MKTIPYLLDNSHLPGPRGNLELLHEFSQEASEDISKKCLLYIQSNTSNSPEEFVGMCGIVGLAMANKKDIKTACALIRPYATHSSWRLREAVVIALQEISHNCFNDVLAQISKWDMHNPLEMRAVVAAVCEPKLLKTVKTNLCVLDLLVEITAYFSKKETLDEKEKVLRQSLGYGWSVLIVHLPAQGKFAFEKMNKSENKHIQWIVRENLKKNRLRKMDEQWVESLV